MGLKVVFEAVVSKIKNRAFRNDVVNPLGSNFERCMECNFLQGCILKYPRDCHEWQALVDNRTQHINYQNACLQIYHD
jgi:hypothetical protein